MDPSSPDETTASPWPRRLRLATWVLLGAGLLLHGAVLAVRGASLLSVWRDALGEGAEGPHVYSLWRVLHDVPLYGPALSAPYVRVPGNAAFYEAWAAGLRLVGAEGEGILLWGRVLVFLSALGGAVAWAGLLRAVSGARRWSLPLGLGALTWLGSHFVGWWVVSLRPELPALACATAGLWLAVEAVTREDARWMRGAGVAFTLAWGMHAQTWGMAAGVAAWLLVSRRWKLLVAGAAPVVGVAAAVALYASPDWVFQQWVAPGLGGVDPGRAHYVLSRVWPVCLPALGVAAWVLARQWSASRPVAGMLLCALVASAGLAAVNVQRTSANREALFELYAVLSVLAARPLLSDGPAWLRAGALASLAAWVAVAPLQLAFPGRFGVMHLEGRWRAGVRAWMQARGGTLLVLDDVLAQPWNSTGGRAPAYVLDLDWLAHAAGPGLHPLLRDVAGQVDAVVGDPDAVALVRGDAEGCTPLPASAGVPGWLECPPR